MSETIKKAVEFAIGIANDNTHGYDQTHRWGNEDFDCSGLVIESWEEAGVPVKTKGATYTGNMKKVFLENGFEEVIGRVNVANGNGLEYGDVLLKEGSHTAIFIGNGQIVHASINENGKVTGGTQGDQTGKEICTRSYYNKPWNSVLRYKEAVATPVSTPVVAPTSVVTPVKKVTTHKVVTGDSLSKIAESHHTAVDKIVADNKATYPKIKPNFIIRGWILKV